MTMIVGDTVSTILQRVRDPHGTGHTRAFVRLILSHAQRVINSATGNVIDETTLTLEPRRLIYNIKAELTSSIRVTGVRFQGEDLPLTTSEELKSYSPTWHRSSSSTPFTYSLYGRNILVIYPAVNTTSSCTVISAKDTGLITADSESFAIADDLIPLVTDLTEITLLIRQRDFEVAKQKIPVFTSRMKGYADE